MKIDIISEWFVINFRIKTVNKCLVNEIIMFLSPQPIIFIKRLISKNSHNIKIQSKRVIVKHKTLV